jgi:hypothetical protein
LVERLEASAKFGIDVIWNNDPDGGQEVAGFLAGFSRDAFAAQTQSAVAVRSRRYCQEDGVAEGRNFDTPAKGGFCDRQEQIEFKVATLHAKDRMGSNTRSEPEVARRAIAMAFATFSGYAKSTSVSYPRRNSNSDRFCESGSVRSEPINCHLVFAAADCIRQVEFDLRFDVVSTLTEGSASTILKIGLSTESSQQIVEVTELELPPNMALVGSTELFLELTALRAGPVSIEAGFERNLSKLIEGRAFLGIGEHVIGDRNVLESRFRCRVPWIKVRMRLSRQLPVPLLDVVLRRIRSDFENLVGVHAPSAPTELGRRSALAKTERVA